MIKSRERQKRKRKLTFYLLASPPMKVAFHLPGPGPDPKFTTHPAISTWHGPPGLSSLPLQEPAQLVPWAPVGPLSLPACSRLTRTPGTPLERSWSLGPLVWNFSCAPHTPRCGVPSVPTHAHCGPPWGTWQLGARRIWGTQQPSQDNRTSGHPVSGGRSRKRHGLPLPTVPLPTSWLWPFLS